ncbi:MAG: MutS-related protein [Solirubrobacteraceae bacterium]
MKVFLMHRDEDFGFEWELPANETALTQDLELDTVCAAMAAGDPLLWQIARRGLLCSLHDPDAILYRQAVLRDCLANPAVVRELYALSGEALQAQRSVWSSFSNDSPRTILSVAVKKMELFVGFLRRLRAMAAEHAGSFSSPGFTRFFAMLAAELDDEYIGLIEGHLKALTFKAGMLISARLGAGNRGTGHTLRHARERGWLERAFDRTGYSFTIPDRDDSGLRALAKLEDRGANLAANALAQSVDHVLSFFTMLRVEVGFYVGCLNLHDRLVEKGEPTTLPTPVARGQLAFATEELYDVSLALTIGQHVVGNDVNADLRSLVMITGANQGGKSTFLRSVGLAQLMMQSGMFVAAETLRASVCDGVFTHYKREEDASMQSGKLDEELARMSEIADLIGPNCLLLCNESFAATNEREGSAIARQVIGALVDAGVRVLFVTHLFDLADGLHRQGSDRSLFLRAPRGAEGARPYALVEGPPLATSYGEDSYRKVFGRSPGDAAAANVRG